MALSSFAREDPDPVVEAPGATPKMGGDVTARLAGAIQLVLQTLGPNFSTLNSQDQLRMVFAVIDRLLRSGPDLKNVPVFGAQLALHDACLTLDGKGDNANARDTFDSSFATLQKWLVDCGSYISDKLVVGRTKEEGNGLFVKENVDCALDVENDTLMRIKKKNILSNDYIAKLPKKLKQIFRKDSLLSSNPSIALVLLLVCERLQSKQASFFAPFLDTLPVNFTTPLFYTPKEAKRVQDISGRGLKSIISYLVNAAKQYSYLCKILMEQDADTIPFELKYFSFDVFRWALSVVMTRQNRIPSEGTGFGVTDTNIGEDFCFALIPFWDLMNHREGKIRTGFNVENHCLESFPIEAFGPGEQVYMCYGERNNLDLLIYSGFSYLENTNHGVTFKLGVSAGDKCFDKRCYILKALGLEGNSESHHQGHGNKKGNGEKKSFSLEFKIYSKILEAHLLAFLRVFVMTEDELNLIIEGLGAFKNGDSNPPVIIGKLVDPATPLNKDTDLRALTFLKNRLSLMLRACDSSIADDEDMLNRIANGTEIVDENPAHVKSVITFNLLEKKIFDTLLGTVEERLNLLEDD
eukprot:Nk52_evm15s2474 gene=Nk52_evmTU15s2474